MERVTHHRSALLRGEHHLWWSWQEIYPDGDNDNYTRVLCYGDDYDELSNFVKMSTTTIYGSHNTNLPPQKKSSALTLLTLVSMSHQCNWCIWASAFELSYCWWTGGWAMLRGNYACIYWSCSTQNKRQRMWTPTHTKKHHNINISFSKFYCINCSLHVLQSSTTTFISAHL